MNVIQVKPANRMGPQAAGLVPAAIEAIGNAE